MTSVQIPELAESKSIVGLFKADYIVGEVKPGAKICNLSLLVYTPKRKVYGIASVVQQAVNPPLHLDFKVEGNYSIMTIMPRIVHIMVVLHGPGGIPIGSTFEIHMVLSENWKSGVASYKYREDPRSPWIEVENAPVTLVK